MILPKKADVVDDVDRKKFAATTSAQFLAALFEEKCYSILY